MRPRWCVKSPVSPPSSAVVRIWIPGRWWSAAGRPVLRISTLARMGRVWRRSTMPGHGLQNGETLFLCPSGRSCRQPLVVLGMGGGICGTGHGHPHFAAAKHGGPGFCRFGKGALTISL